MLGQGDVDGSSRFWLSSDRVEAFLQRLRGPVLVLESSLARFTHLAQGDEADEVAASHSPRFDVSTRRPIA